MSANYFGQHEDSKDIFPNPCQADHAMSPAGPYYSRTRKVEGFLQCSVLERSDFVHRKWFITLDIVGYLTNGGVLGHTAIVFEQSHFPQVPECLSEWETAAFQITSDLQVPAVGPARWQASQVDGRCSSVAGLRHCLPPVFARLV